MSRRQCAMTATNGRGVLAIIEGSTKYPSRVKAAKPSKEWIITDRTEGLKHLQEFERLCLTQALLVESAK